MRTNKLGERYCHTSDEVRAIANERGIDWESVYVLDSIMEFDSDSGGDQATAEVATDEDEDLICYIEAPTETDVRAIIAELGLEIV